MARISVHTGIAPQHLLELDADWFDALVQAVEQHWPVERELAATHVELAHAHLVAFSRVHGKKRQRVPEPLRIERPGQATQQRAPAAAPPPPRVSILELARTHGASADLVGAS